MNSIVIGSHSHLCQSVVDDNVRLGPGFSCYCGTAYVHMDDGFHNVPKIGCMIGDESTTGARVVISPGCIIGQGCRIGDGAKVSTNVENRSISDLRCAASSVIPARGRPSEVLLDALRRLEYRGYDSAGIAIMNPELQLHKDKGEIAEMQRTLPQINGHVGIGHTRWATCGKPSNENAHPFLDCHGRIAVVHNGIIENYMALKEQLQNEGHMFTSQTDTEVIVHLIEKHDKGDLHQAVRAAVAEIKGTYAIACIEKGSGQDRRRAGRRTPWCIGLGIDENFVASDVTAIFSYTNKVLYVMDGETVVITPERSPSMALTGRWWSVHPRR